MCILTEHKLTFDCKSLKRWPIQQLTVIRSLTNPRVCYLSWCQFRRSYVYNEYIHSVYYTWIELYSWALTCVRLSDCAYYAIHDQTSATLSLSLSLSPSLSVLCEQPRCYKKLLLLTQIAPRLRPRLLNCNASPFTCIVRRLFWKKRKIAGVDDIVNGMNNGINKWNLTPFLITTFFYTFGWTFNAVFMIVNFVFKIFDLMFEISDP